MLLQLENTTQENINKLLSFAREHHLHLSVIDDEYDSNFLPGEPLTPAQLEQVIKNSRESGKISLEDAHMQIANRTIQS